jgi:hypothetical protein
MEKYSGRIIEVRGAFLGDALVGPGFDFRTRELVRPDLGCGSIGTQGDQWLQGIYLEYPQNINDLLDGLAGQGLADIVWPERAQWTFNRAAADQVDREYAAAWDEALERADGGVPPPIMVTVAGRLDTRPEGLQVFDDKEGQLFFNGFGHLGVYPAELVIVAIRDIEIGSAPE